MAAMERDTRALIKEAQTATTTPARLGELAASEQPEVRRAVARNGALPDESLGRLLEDPVWEVRTVAAHHKKAPRDRTLAILADLARSPEAPQRAVAARSPHTPPEILVQLAGDADAETRSNAVRNPRTPAQTARDRLTDGEPCVVLGALAHPSVSNDERRAFLTEEFLMRFFEAHADGDHLFEALCEKYLWDVLERAFLDPERFDDTWQDLVGKHFELIEIPSRGSVLAAVHRDHWKAVIARLADEVRGHSRRPD
jgi:leucine rich repeat (LRR) protein